MSEPTTEAGRQYLAIVGNGMGRERRRKAILAIEAEARAEAVRERDQQERFKWAANERADRFAAAARFMLELVDVYYGTDHEFDVPDEAEFRRHRDVILAERQP